MASDGCVKYKLYNQAFKNIAPNIHLIYPDESFQKLVTQGICNIKSKTRFSSLNSPERSCNIFPKVIKHLIEKGCDGIVLGCTDIAVDFNFDYNYNVEIIDSLHILANNILDISN